MDKESIFERQLIDTNCSDCKFMVRDVLKYKDSLATHKRWQLEAHEIKQRREGTNKAFQFDKKKVSINYGFCSKLSKDVSFIPNHCSPENEECFKHRKT